MTPGMTLQIGHLSLVDAPAASATRGGSGPKPEPVRPAHPPVTADVIPPAPPAEVLEDVAAAAERAEALAAANRELHFAKDPESGRIIVQVRDLDGNVVRTIPPSQALDVMSGLSEP